MQTDIMGAPRETTKPKAVGAPGSGAASSVGTKELERSPAQPALPCRESPTSNNSQLESQEPETKRARTENSKELLIVGGEAKVPPQPCIPSEEAGKTTSTFKVVQEIIPYVWLSVTARARS